MSNHKLNLPELPEPEPGVYRLSWKVTLTLGGMIHVALVQEYATLPPQTVFSFDRPDQETAEDHALRAWRNYRAVHGGVAS